MAKIKAPGGGRGGVKHFVSILMLSDSQFQGLSKMVLLFAPKFSSQKLWSIMQEGVWRPAGKFLYKLIGPKMAQKWPKMAIFSPKNASNYLKFGNLVYLDGFYWFPKFWKFSPKIGQFLDEKPPFFCWRGKNFEFFFSTEIVSSLWEMIQLV